MKLLSMVVLVAMATFPALAGDAEYWRKMADDIAAEITHAESLALDGKGAEAKKAVVQAYFGLFESGKMEAALRKEIGAREAFDREKQFGDLRKLVAGGDAASIKTLARALRDGLAADGKALDAARVPPEVFEVNQ